MKKLFAALFLSATALCTAQDHSLREVYDLYKPDGVTPPAGWHRFSS